MNSFRTRIGLVPHGAAALSVLILLSVAIAACGDQEPVGIHRVDDQASSASIEGVPAGLATGSGLPWNLDGEVIRDRYIVRLRESAPSSLPVLEDLTGRPGVVLHHVYEHTIRGFAATLPGPAAEAVRQHPLVATVHRDVILRAQTASWGLSRINKRTLPLDGIYAPYGSGSPVRVYVLDTGIMAAHQSFSGRAITGPDSAFDAFRQPSDPYYAEDCYPDQFPEDSIQPSSGMGHGTHVAGTIGASAYGVTGVEALVSVRVVDCFVHQGPIAAASTIAAGVEWITATADPGQPAVANMSVESYVVTPVTDSALSDMEDAIRESIDSTGITYVAAAGNSNSDACGVSPARMAEVIRVGATDSADYRYTYSNYGSCVDLFAPGVDIVSAGVVVDPDVSQPDFCSTCSGTMTGTSMAAPHVAGAAAIVLSQYPSLTVSQVRDTLVARATTGQLQAIGAGSPDRLLFVDRILTGEIWGPHTTDEDETYTWYSGPGGGNGTTTFQWETRQHSGGYVGPWSVAGNNENLQYWVWPGHTDFDLRLTISSGFQTVTDSQHVTVECVVCPESVTTPEVTEGGGGS